MIPGQICDLHLSEDHRQLDFDEPPLFPCSCYNVDVRQNVAQEVPWHWHEELEAICVVEGQGIFGVGSALWTLGPGDGLLINTNTLHSVRLPEGGDCRIHSLVFSAGLLAGEPGSVFEQRYLAPVLASPTRVLLLRGDGWQRQALEAIEEAYEAYAAEGFGWELRVRSALSRLWVLAAPRMADAGPAAEEGADTLRLKTMLGYLHEHFDQPVLLEQVAAAAHLGKRECLRCFKRTIGVSPIQYLLDYRIRHACRRLAGSDLPVTEIALECGFEGASYFSKLFRKAIGQSPRAYRAAARQAAGPTPEGP